MTLDSQYHFGTPVSCIDAFVMSIDLEKLLNVKVENRFTVAVDVVINAVKNKIQEFLKG